MLNRVIIERVILESFFIRDSKGMASLCSMIEWL